LRNQQMHHCDGIMQYTEFWIHDYSVLYNVYQ